MSSRPPRARAARSERVRARGRRGHRASSETLAGGGRSSSRLAVVAALLLTGSQRPPQPSAAQPSPPPPVATTMPSARAGASFTIVMRDSLSRRVVLVDPRGRAVRLAITADEGLRPLDVVAPPPLDVSLGGLPAGRRPVAVLDKSIVLVPGIDGRSSGRGLWAGGSEPPRGRRRGSVRRGLRRPRRDGRPTDVRRARCASARAKATSCRRSRRSPASNRSRQVRSHPTVGTSWCGSPRSTGRSTASRSPTCAAGSIEPLFGVGGDDALAMACGHRLAAVPARTARRHAIRARPRPHRRGSAIEEWNGARRCGRVATCFPSSSCSRSTTRSRRRRSPLST